VQEDQIEGREEQVRPTGDMRVYSKEFRMKAVERVMAGEKVGVLSKELGIHRKLLYDWVRRVTEGGQANLRERGRPRKGDLAAASPDAARRIAELERLVGRQQLAIEFFRLALQRIEESRQRRSPSGATASTERSRS
jgi:transposase